MPKRSRGYELTVLMYILCDQEISEMIEAVDLDGDGQINFEEYKELNAMMNYRLLYFSHTRQLAEWDCLVKTGKLVWNKKFSLVRQTVPDLRFVPRSHGVSLTILSYYSVYHQCEIPKYLYFFNIDIYESKSCATWLEIF